MSQPSPDAPARVPSSRERDRRLWACAGCLFLVAVLLVLVGVVVRAWLAPEGGSYQRDTDVSQLEQPAEDAPAEGQGEAASPAPEGALKLVSFVTPSGNIACTFDGDAVGCSVRDRDYPEDVDCSDGPFSVRIADGAVETACGEDFTGQDAPELAYGASAVSGSVACTSESDGLTCWDTRKGTGFTLSREQYETF